jgi:hypothetical protein
LPELAAISLLLIVGFFVAFGMALTARSWSHSMTVWITRSIGVPQFLADRIVEGSIALTKLVTHELGRYAIPATDSVVRWLAGLGQYAALVDFWSLAWPKELYTFGYWLIHTYIPRVLHGTLRPIIRVVHGTVKVVHTVETRIVHVAKAVPATAKTVVIQTVPRTVREAAREIEWLRRHWKALTAAVAGAGAISLPWGGAGRIERDVLGLRKLFDRINRRTIGLGAVALVAAALARMGLSWIRCRNVVKTGKRLCGMDGSWLDSLLLDTVAILSVLSVVEFAEAMLEIEGVAVDVLARGIREFPAV